MCFEQDELCVLGNRPSIKRGYGGLVVETKYNGHPKMENTSFAVNQQGHALSYVLGVYFGDACIDTAWTNKDGTERKRIRLRVIDKDFIAAFSEAFQTAFPNTQTTIWYDEKIGKKGRFGKQPMHCVSAMDGVPEYIESITGKRTIIPNLVYQSDDSLIQFIIGLLDSEGWVAILKQDLGKFYLQIGLATTSEMVYEVKKILNKLGIKTGKVLTKKYPSGKILKTILFNTQSFVESNLYFNIRRKQKRIEAFLAARKRLDKVGYNPNGVGFNDDKREYRERVRKEFLANV